MITMDRQEHLITVEKEILKALSLSYNEILCLSSSFFLFIFTVSTFTMNFRDSFHRMFFLNWPFNYDYSPAFNEIR